MKVHGFKRYLLALLLLGFSGSGWAIAYAPPPLPSGLSVGADIQGTGLFTPGLPLLAFELIDLGEPAGPPFDFEFGYYFASAVADGTLDAVDRNPIFTIGDPSNGPVTTSLGIVAPLGFYVLDPDIGQLSTQQTLNPGGVDVAGVFPILDEPTGQAPDNSYLIGFVVPFGQFEGTTFYAAISGPLTPSPIPLPGAIFLWLSGLAGLALFRRILSSASPVTATAT